MEYNLNRFILAQESNYLIALSEIKSGYKKTHWMWYIFPQLKGLAMSSTSEYYGIDGLDEAIEYFNNEYLRNNLLEISKSLLEIDNSDIEDVIGYPDNLKLQSSMTLFNEVDSSETVFQDVLNKYYDGQKDQITLKLIKKNSIY